MTIAGWAVALLAAQASAGSPPLAPATASVDNAGPSLTATELFGVAERLSSAGDAARAETLLVALTRDPDLDIRTEARFRLAASRTARGDTAGAISALRALLVERPDTPRPRLELARLLAASGDESGARRELRRAGAAGLPDDVARVVDQFALALRSRAPFGGSIEVAIAPDSNINRSTRSRTLDTVLAPFELDDDARARSGVGLGLSGQAYARGNVAGTPALARLSGRGDLYRASRFNDVAVSFAAGPEITGGKTRWRPAALVSQRWYGGDPYSFSYGASLNWLRPLDAQSQLEAEATILNADYRNDAQSGAVFDASLAYDRAVTPTLSGRIAIRAIRADADDPAFSTTSGALDLVVAKTIAGQTVIGQVGLGLLRSDEPFALFGRARRERRLDLTLGLLLGRFQYRGLSPLIRVTQSFNSSTIGLYDFRRTRLELGLSRAF